MVDLKFVELGDIAEVTMGQSPKSEYYNTDKEGLPFLQGNKTFGFKYPSFDMYTSSITKIAKKDSILMSVRAPVGDLNIASEDLCIGRGLCSLNMKNDNNNFLYYLLKFNLPNLLNRESGTVFGSINKKDIETLEVAIPKEESIQYKIVDILLSIDNLIIILKKINHNLDTIAKLIYKGYFEDFKFFSDIRFKNSELGKIPDNWKTFDLNSIAKIYNGYSYKSKELQKSNCAMLTIKNFNRNGSFKTEGFKEIVYSEKIKDFHFINENDVLIACTDVTQNADIIGNCILLQNKKDYKEIIMSMDLVKVESKFPEINNFLLASILKSYRFKKHILGYVNGTTVLHLDKKGILNFTVALPQDLSKLVNIEKKLEYIYRKISINSKEINYLENLKSILLPKLMSGEIDVSNIKL